MDWLTAVILVFVITMSGCLAPRTYITIEGNPRGKCTEMRRGIGSEVELGNFFTEKLGFTRHIYFVCK